MGIRKDAPELPSSVSPCELHVFVRDFLSEPKAVALPEGC
jgi:hypothetical protein